MLQPDVVARLRLLVDTARVPNAADTTRVNEVSALTSGQRVTARVGREIADARFYVTVLDKTFEMKLPAGVRPGQTLELSYVSNTPRPTFLLTSTAPTVQGNELSQLGRLIAALLGPKQRTADGAAAQRTVAPLTANPADTIKTPALLRAALAESGIFYESHQAQWVAGRLPLGQLRREPQGQLPPLPKPQAEPGPAGKNATQVAPGSSISTASNAAERIPVADLRTTGPVNSPPTPAGTAQQSPIHPETAPIVRQQLETLDTRHVIWQGEAWPDQWMEWETGEEPKDPENGPQAAWYSTLTLELPRLGKVRIRTVLAGTGARVRVEFADGAAGERLRAAQALLATNLQSRGIDLADFTVNASALTASAVSQTGEKQGCTRSVSSSSISKRSSS